MTRFAKRFSLKAENILCINLMDLLLKNDKPFSNLLSANNPESEQFFTALKLLF